MKFLQLGAAVLLVGVFATALVVRDNQGMSTASAAPLPEICGDALADHGGASMQAHLDMMAAGVGESHAALLQTMEPMHSDMMRGMTAQDFQTAFVCSMIPHHQGAVEMALVAQQYGTDPFVKMFAQEIITTQRAEILEMQAWLSRKAAQQ